MRGAALSTSAILGQRIEGGMYRPPSPYDCIIISTLLCLSSLARLAPMINLRGVK